MPRSPQDQPESRGLRTRRALVEAALELFAEQGVDGTSIDEVTAAANVAKGTFYVHFQRKQDVLLEWAAQLVGRLEDADLGAHGVDALPVIAQLLADRMTERPRPLVGRMVREIVGNSSDWLRVLGDRKPLNMIVLEYVQTAQKEDDLRSDMTARRLSMALTVMWLDNVIGWSERERALPLEDSLKLTTDLFINGARTPR